MPDERTRRYERVLREYGPALSRLVHAYARDVTDREDLLQDVAFALWKAFPSFRGECSERTFVFRVAHNRGLSHRARSSRPSISLDEVEEIRDARPTPEEDARRNERHAALWDAVRGLSPGLQQVVILRLEGLADREIADVTGLSENNVAVRLTRARKQLRQALGEDSA